MKKLIIRLPLILLSFVGVLVNLLYYINSHNNSGYGPLLAFLMSIAFIGFEYVLYLYQVKVLSLKRLKALKILIILFSILITMSAQFYSTSKSETVSKKSINNTEIILQQIDDNRAEKDQLNNRLNTYSEQDNAKAAREDSEARIKFLTSENDRLYKSLTSDETIIEAPKNAYDYYADKASWLEPEDVRIVFQFISSFLLAILAPVALTIMKNIKDKEAGEPKPEKRKKTVKKKEDKKEDRERVNYILKYMLYSDENLIKKPGEAYEYFKRLVQKNPDKYGHLNYSLAQIESVYNEIYKRKLQSEKKEIIKEKILNG